MRGISEQELEENASGQGGNRNLDFIDDDGLSDDSQQEMSWIGWFCSLPGHQFYCEVPEDFIEDDFNLVGLSNHFTHYEKALNAILEIEPDTNSYDTAQFRRISEQAEILYGLIHQRYILTRHGLYQMHEKYQNGEFGLCPRDYCNGAHALPCGIDDQYGQESVKLYCPHCQDVYNPYVSRFNTIDGASFGTTFPHLFMLTFPNIISSQPKVIKEGIYTERVFGFKISDRSPHALSMKWLRKFDFSDEENLSGMDDDSNSDDDKKEEISVTGEKRIHSDSITPGIIETTQNNGH